MRTFLLVSTGILAMAIPGCSSSDDAGGPPGSGGTSSGALSECDPFASGDDFRVCTATYLTDDADDHVGGIAMGADGAVLYAGSVRADDYGITATSVLQGGNAGVVRLAPNGRLVLGVTRVGSKVNDIEVHRETGNIAVCGDFGVAMLDAQAKEILWSAATGGEAKRVAVGSDGTVAVLTGTTLVMHDSAGTELGTAEVSTNQTVHDIAVHGPSQTVIATGFKQDDGGGCTELQVPFIRAYGYDGAATWKAYDWAHAEVAAVSECADSRGLALSIGLDGKLYYAGRSDGGNTVHNRMPDDLSAQAPNTKFDKYTDPYNMNGAASVTYLARFDAATGAIEAGIKHVVRLTSDDKGNSMVPHAITALADGTIVAAGTSACCIPGADTKTVNGELAMPGYAGGGWVLMLSPTLDARLAWTVFRGETGGNEAPVGVATDGNGMAVLMQQNQDDAPIADAALLTFDALQPSPGGGAADAYLSVWRAP